jgi:hypothetical protein
MDYQKAAQTALDVQDACVLSGVAKSLAGPVMDAIWAEARRLNKGTDWVNENPIVTLFLNKMQSLNRGEFSPAYDAVEKIAQP